jgi:hypothetical protein
LTWKANPNNPPRSSESCVLTGDPTAAGLYYTLVRWWPGYMSAPHTYTSTPHYDGVIRSHNEPAIIAICGIGPVNYKLTDPSKPGGRAV